MLSEIQAYAYAALAGALLAVTAWFGYHERHVEATEIHAAQAAADAKAQVQITKVQADATASIQDLQVRLASSLAAPPLNPLVVRLCAAPSKFILARPEAPGPFAVGDDAGRPSAGVAGAGDPGPDIGPATEVMLSRLGAKLAYLQGYVAACQTAGVCGKTP